MFYRYLLLSLLPVIAIIIYLDGQNYDPGLLDFQRDKNENQTINSFLQKKNGIYQRSGQIRQYDKDDLNEYINGRAEFFLSFGFRKLAVADYSLETPEKKNPEFVVDIYDMGKTENAFGILMEESGESSTPIKIGFKGFFTQKTLNFISGQYYIKISAYNNKTSLVAFAKGLEIYLGNRENSIPQLAKFPPNGVVYNSTKFIKENYHGLSFVKNVYEQKYEINSEKFKMFLIEGTNNEIKNLLNQYFEFFEEDGLKYQMLEYNNQTYYKIFDPFEGNWYLIPLNNELFGIYGPLSKKMLVKLIGDLK